MKIFESKTRKYRIKKVSRRNGNSFYSYEFKSYGLFNSWVDGLNEFTSESEAIDYITKTIKSDNDVYDYSVVKKEYI